MTFVPASIAHGVRSFSRSTMDSKCGRCFGPIGDALTVTLRLSDPIVFMPPTESVLLDFRRADYATLSDLLTVTD